MQGVLNTFCVDDVAGDLRRFLSDRHPDAAECAATFVEERIESRAASLGKVALSFQMDELATRFRRKECRDEKFSGEDVAYILKSYANRTYCSFLEDCEYEPA